MKSLIFFLVGSMVGVSAWAGLPSDTETLIVSPSAVTSQSGGLRVDFIKRFNGSYELQLGNRERGACSLLLARLGASFSLNQTVSYLSLEDLKPLDNKLPLAQADLSTRDDVFQNLGKPIIYVGTVINGVGYIAFFFSHSNDGHLAGAFGSQIGGFHVPRQELSGVALYEVSNRAKLIKTYSVEYRSSLRTYKEQEAIAMIVDQEARIFAGNNQGP